jgi:hypothetical protein
VCAYAIAAISLGAIVATAGSVHRHVVLAVESAQMDRERLVAITVTRSGRRYATSASIGYGAVFPVVTVLMARVFGRERADSAAGGRVNSDRSPRSDAPPSG